MQLPVGDLIFPGIGWPPNVAAPAAQMPMLGLPVPDLAGRGVLQHDLAAALSLQRTAEPSTEPAAQQQPQQRSGQNEEPLSGPSAGSEMAGRSSSDGGALAGKLAALTASKASEPRSNSPKLSCGFVEEEGKVQVSARLL